MARLSGSNEDSIPPTQGADGTGLTMNNFFFCKMVQMAKNT